MELGKNITDITSKFDMEGEMVQNYQQVTELASYLMKVDIAKGYVDFGYDTEFSAENPVSQYSRGIVFWGGPLEDRNQSTSTDSEEREEVKQTERDERKEFVKKHYLDSMNKQSDKSTHSQINSYYFMTAIIGDVILEIVSKDALLALFSLAFVFIWLRVNTLSWFLAFVGLIEIFFSIPIAWFIFTVVFQIKYFATLNALALFVVAAIGADDIFIFMDAYKQSQYHLHVLTDLETRMSWVYRRTGTAMAITSATTCAAFLCTLLTPLTSIQSFGIFAAVVIFIDYVLVMSLFCTAVVIYHNRYENKATCGCCCPCGPVQPSNTEQARIALEGHEGEMTRDRVSEFFRTKVAGFIKVPLHRLVLGVIFVVWLSIAIWQMSQIEATKESEQFLDENHPLQKSLTILDKQFPTADDDLGLKVHFAWGIDRVDRSGVNMLTDPEYFGKPQFVREFEFNQQCQSDLLDFCNKLRTDSQYEELIKRKNGVGQVYCFIEELAAFNVKGNLDDCEYVRKGEWRNEANVTWQVDPVDLPKIMPDFLKAKTCYDESGIETISGRYQDEIGWDGLYMRYASVAAESNVLDPFGLDAESVTRREYDQFIEISEQQDAISKSCGGAVIMTDLDSKFVFMNNQAIYVQSAIQSSCLGVAIAFVVLLISTRVFHLAFFASLSILSVLVSVVGTMVMLGWDLGSIESILIGIIAGFSVDYVVHLAHAYEIAKGDTYERITEAFSDLGISVFNGMITSVVASIPLFFCQLQFFAKFGTFLCLTIAFSWIFANFGFMSLLAQLKIPLKNTKGCSL
jgi:predicted RND superfamily exporter protein